MKCAKIPCHYYSSTYDNHCTMTVDTDECDEFIPMGARSSTETLIKALRILARDIKSGDGVANMCIAEAADRLDELYGIEKDGY